MVKQPDPVESRVYKWPQQFEELDEGIAKAKILSGSTTALYRLDVDAYQLQPGVTLVGGGTLETMVIVKSGVLTVEMEGEDVELGPGSVYVSFPGGGMGIGNHTADAVEYYQFMYSSRQGADTSRINESERGYFVDWDELDVRETQRGEHRHYFDRPTALLSRFEMHVTTLNEGLTSHDVHTHREEEFLLIIHSEVEEHIDGSNHRASAGDLIFLDSMVPHTITNVGTGPTQYFAFKWE